ncbi:MAG: FTR1 family protein, partial [Anaerolineales bacterium]
MLAASLISFHEGLEAALIVGILIGYLVKIGQRGQVRVAWAGVAAAVFASALVALGIRAVDDGLRGRARQVFDGTIMFLAVGVLTWMIFWMRSQARFLKGSLEREVQTAVTSGQALALFG